LEVATRLEKIGKKGDGKKRPHHTNHFYKWEALGRSGIQLRDVYPEWKGA